jgi:RimJ/RimL family protein N-acetyltransferase
MAWKADAMRDATKRPRLETGRLVMRPLTEADAAPMTPLADDIGVARMTTSIPHPFNQDMAEGFIGRMAMADPDWEIVLGVEHAHDGAFMGVIGIHPKEGLAPELGYWIGRPFWGQGYMTEAVSAMLGWARADWGRRVLTSGHFTDNAPSGQVLIKSDFLYTGEVEQRFSIARGESAPTRMMVWLA